MVFAVGILIRNSRYPLNSARMLLFGFSAVVVLGAVSSIYIPECRVHESNKIDMLMTADCSNGSLQNVPLLDSRGHITRLDLSRNQITILTNLSFSGYEHLEYIDLRDNKIERIEASVFRNLSGLRQLHLSGNVLTSINRDLLAENSSIVVLSLRENSFRDVPGDSSFLVSPTLAWLDLSDCKMTQLAGNFFAGVRNLTHIYLSNNYLTSLSFHAFEHLYRLNVIALDGNPWNCTCELIKTLQLLQKRNVEVNPTHMMCSLGTEKNNITSVVNENSCLQEVIPENMSTDSLPTVQPSSVQISPNHETISLETMPSKNGNEVTTPKRLTEELGEVFTSHAQNVSGMKKSLLFWKILMTLLCLFIL